MSTITDYQKQALDFLDKIGATMTATFIKHDKYFQDDEQKRDIYEVVFTRQDRFPLKLTFGQSINNSGKFTLKPHLAKAYGTYCTNDLKDPKLKTAAFKVNGSPNLIGEYIINGSYSAPTPYDVLASIQKYDVGTLENFCSEFGYDSDSRKAEKIYFDVKAEYEKVKAFFSPEELEEAQEIQ